MRKNMNKLIELKNVRKNYGNKEVLKDINLIIKKRERIALLGANGAGKSTLIKIIIGLIKQTDGEFINYLQSNVKLGYASQEDYLINDLKVYELIKLNMYAKKIKINKDDFQNNLEKYGLNEVKNKYVYQLSGGQKRKLTILMSLLSNPDLLVLDEPTTGMDLESIDNLWDELKAQTSSSLIVTHDFNQIDNYFTRIIIIKNNRIVADEKVTDIHNKNKTIENFYRSIIGGKNND